MDRVVILIMAFLGLIISIPVIILVSLLGLVLGLLYYIAAGFLEFCEWVSYQFNELLNK